MAGRALMARAVVGALTIAAAASGVASAQEIRVMSAPVYKGDLDLSKMAGAQVMLQRIQTTAARLCEPTVVSPLRTGVGVSDIRQCRAQALDQAVADLGAPVLTSEYERLKAGRSAVTAAR
jgi:UrcA family protein